MAISFCPTLHSTVEKCYSKNVYDCVYKMLAKNVYDCVYKITNCKFKVGKWYYRDVVSWEFNAQGVQHF